MISSSQLYYKEYTSIFWCEKFTEEHFRRELNECLNKLTDDNEGGSIAVSNQLGKLCLISPYITISEILHRIFNGQLKYTAAEKVRHFINDMCFSTSFIRYYCIRTLWMAPSGIVVF